MLNVDLSSQTITVSGEWNCWNGEGAVVCSVTVERHFRFQISIVSLIVAGSCSKRTDVLWLVSTTEFFTSGTVSSIANIRDINIQE